MLKRNMWVRHQNWVQPRGSHLPKSGPDDMINKRKTKSWKRAHLFLGLFVFNLLESRAISAMVFALRMLGGGLESWGSVKAGRELTTLPLSLKGMSGVASVTAGILEMACQSLIIVPQPHAHTHTHTFKRITLSSHPVQGSDRQRTNCTHPYRRQCRWNLQTRFLNTPDPLAAQLATISLLLALTVLRLRGGGAPFLWFATFPWAKRPLGLLGHGDAGPGLPGGSRPTQALGMGGTTQREPSKSCGWLRYVSTKGNPSHVKFRWMKGMCFSGGGLNGSKSSCCFHALPRCQSVDNNSTLIKIREGIFTIVV